MNRLLLFITLLFSGTALSAQTIPERLDQLLSAYAEMYRFNGSVLIAQHGKPLLEKGYGFKNREDSSFADQNTIYQIGSVTKQFTSTIILKLQEQGKLSVNDKLSKYFPSFPKGDSITLHHLLTHTSGIFNYTNDGKFMNSEVAKSHSQEQMLALFRERPLDFSPGTRFSYSNSGYLLLGYIIEKITKKPWETVMREMIFTPLGMTHSGFDFAHLESSDKAIGYFTLDSVRRVRAPVVDSTVAYSAGSMYSTVGDLYKWERAVSAGKILKASSWKKAFTPFLNNYAYGWAVDTLHNRKVIRHGGGIHGFNSELVRFPEQDVVIILIANKPGPYLASIVRRSAAIVFGLAYDLPRLKKEGTVEPEKLRQYEGVFEISPGRTVTMSLEGDRLKTQINGQPKFDLFFEKPDHFFLKNVDAALEYVRDEKGIITSVIMHQNDNKTVARKIKE